MQIFHLGSNVLVGEANNKTVLGGIVLVLVLNNQAKENERSCPYTKLVPLAGIVVRLALTAPAELDLEALEVHVVLNNLDETLRICKQPERGEIIIIPFDCVGLGRLKKGMLDNEIEANEI